MINKPGRLSAILLFILIAAAIHCFAQDLVQIQKVVSFKSGLYEDVVIFTDSHVHPSVKALESPKRLAMIFPNTNICAETSMPGKTKLIKKIEAYQHDPNTAYVTVHPAENLNYSYGGFSGNRKFVMEFTAAKPWSMKVIESDTVEASGASETKKTKPEASKVYKESFECVISYGAVYVVTSEVKKIPPLKSAPKKKSK